MSAFRPYLFIAILILAPFSAQADSIDLIDRGEEGWRFDITPYAFLPASIEGTSVVAGSELKLDLDFQDALDLLDFAFSARTEGWKGNFGVISDLYYIDLGVDAELEIPPPPPGEATLFIDADIRQAWLSALGAYRFAHGEYGSNGYRYAWDVSLGARWNYLKQEIRTRLGTDIGIADGQQQKLGGSESWWEPVIGLRGMAEISPCLAMAIRLEAGGFGVNDDERQWIGLIGLDWRPWEHTSLKFGAQAYGIDYETRKSDGEFAYDIEQYGPYLGVTLRF
ncbi:hypothetical protein [Biformimicrobium ophioploci]|uniref:DUF1207 domain-containing protein n=1 Tax=Biformimicrobium ophioploci TaxID=3036711 RepID=A0ABQ6M0E1_9GAMM|nr:hypothetical protein [Microbulbifer sp. NKW57]GMG87788.1 hypothetical protein MNKW57_21090 [Microbulbifer sp. NKW57]